MTWATREECDHLKQLASEKRKACIRCIYFDEHAEEPTVYEFDDGQRWINKEGFCHRYPPTIVSEDFPDDCRNMHVWVGWHDWCGEFEENSEWEKQCEPSRFAD